MSIEYIVFVHMYLFSYKNLKYLIFTGLTIMVTLWDFNVVWPLWPLMSVIWNLMETKVLIAKKGQRLATLDLLLKTVLDTFSIIWKIVNPKISQIWNISATLQWKKNVFCFFFFLYSLKAFVVLIID